MRTKSRLGILIALLLVFAAPALRAVDGVTVSPRVAGFFNTDLKYMIAGEPSKKVDIPIPFYVIRHPKGLVLFDCGLGLDFYQDLAGWWVHRLFQKTLPYRFDPADAATVQVTGMGLDTKDVIAIVVSHLHYDHAGGLRDFPNAKVIVSRKEWEYANVGRWKARFRGVMSETLQGVAGRLQLVDGDGLFDLFGDGSLVLMPTPGHTPGHQSLIVTTESGRKVLLTGDAVWTRENYLRPVPKSWIVRTLEESDAGQAWSSTLAIRKFADEHPDALIIPGHDPELWKELPPEIR